MGQPRDGRLDVRRETRADTAPRYAVGCWGRRDHARGSRRAERQPWRAHEVKLDLEHALDVERARTHLRERIVGDYHSEPDGDGQPSGGDLRGWLRGLQLLASRSSNAANWLLGDETPLECHVGIIVTRCESAWPKLHAWVTRVDGNSVVCEPAGVWS